jgi:hypothetical protein
LASGGSLVTKYQPLCDHLRRLDRRIDHSLTFAEIERVLGFRLPSSARKYQAWWANQRNGGHVQANAWLDEAWHTQDLDLKRQQVTFRPVDLPRAPKAPARSDGTIRPLTIAKAKQAVALHSGVHPKDVEITIRSWRPASAPFRIRVRKSCPTRP